MTASSEALKRAKKKYAQTEKGKEVLKASVKKYQETEQGKQKLKEAQERFEATEERKEYKREWFRQRRLRIKTERLEAEKSN